mmetsp:Transcript_23954/g.61139  ORF Transcript_23954/g.61139 Transcript_23954/m.61139 type:complete len:205 (-) Transcript_23954:1024-1638(-)
MRSFPLSKEVPRAFSTSGGRAKGPDLPVSNREILPRFLANTLSFAVLPTFNFSNKKPSLASSHGNMPVNWSPMWHRWPTSRTSPILTSTTWPTSRSSILTPFFNSRADSLIQAGPSWAPSRRLGCFFKPSFASKSATDSTNPASGSSRAGTTSFSLSSSSSSCFLVFCILDFGLASSARVSSSSSFSCALASTFSLCFFVSFWN